MLCSFCYECAIRKYIKSNKTEIWARYRMMRATLMLFKAKYSNVGGKNILITSNYSLKTIGSER